MPGQTGPAWFVLQGQHGLVWFWPGTVRFDLQCKRSISLCVVAGSDNKLCIVGACIRSLSGSLCCTNVFWKNLCGVTQSTHAQALYRKIV